MMKKIFTVAAAFAAVMFSRTASAQPSELMYQGTEKYDAASVISGSADVLNEKGTLCSLTYDFSEARIVNFDRDNRTVIEDKGTIAEYNQSHGEAYVRDWPENLEVLNATTSKAMGKKLKSEFLPKSSAQGAKYDVVIKPALFDMGHFVAIGGAKDGGNIIKGVVFVFESGTENLVASFDLNYVRGNNIGYGNNDRIKQLGSSIAKALKNL